MARLPAFLNARSLQRQGARNLHAELHRQFGWSLPMLGRFEEISAPDFSVPFVRDAFAREALLLHSLGETIPEDWLGALSQAKPVQGVDATLEDLMQEEWMPALFPLDTGNGHAMAGIVWVAATGRTLIEPPGMVGDSWQLAAEIARKALSEKASMVVKRRLATELIYSGAVEHGKVRPVDAGNKSSLAVPSRIWVVPERGWDGENGAFGVGTVEDAWGITADEWTRHHEAVAAWPEEVDAFHSFVSKAIAPPIEAILCSRPKNVHLWVSEMKEAMPNARLIIDFFSGDLPVPFQGYRPEFFIHDVSSRNLAVVEAQLRKLIDPARGEERVVFNITTGNRLQGFAASNVVRLLRKKNGRLVYKDIDNKQLGEMVEISFDPGSESPKSRLLSAGDRLERFSTGCFGEYKFHPKDIHQLRDGLIRGRFKKDAEK